MESLLDSFQNVKLNGASELLTGKKMPCYISDIFSPSRLYIQLCEPELDKLMDDLKMFYSNPKNAETFQLKETQIKVGLKVALYVCNAWHRAEVMSRVTKRGMVYVFMMDYGTTGYVELRMCKLLLDVFNKFKRKAIRACLFSLAPVNKDHRLFPLDATKFIVAACYNKIYNIEFLKFHEDGDFYEIIARGGDGNSLNEQLVLHKHARFFNPIQLASKFSIHYPSFDLLERTPSYQSFTHRLVFRDNGVDFNDFEEKCIRILPDRSYEEQFKEWINNHRFKRLKEIYEYISS